MLRVSLGLAIALQLFVLPSFAEEKPYQIPAEHKEFYEQFEALKKKYPKSAARFALVDLEKAKLRLTTVWECDWQDHEMTCEHSHPE